MNNSNPFRSFSRPFGGGDLLDRFGRVLAEGDMVILSGRGDLVWRISKIRPILDLNAPPGAKQITFTAAVESGVQSNMPVMEFIKVRDVSEYLPSGDSLATEESPKVVS
jgi:hypothetical protein